MRGEYITYPRLARWSLQGIGYTIAFLLVLMWGPIWEKMLWPFIRGTCRFSYVLIVEFFRLIHKQERVWCGIFGTLGGATGYLTLHVYAKTLEEIILVIMCCGALGTLFGVAAHKLLTKLLQHTSFLAKER